MCPLSLMFMLYLKAHRVFPDSLVSTTGFFNIKFVLDMKSK